MFQPPHNSGFTLVELLIVVGVLGVLSTVVVVLLKPGEIQEKAYENKMAYEGRQWVTLDGSGDMVASDYTTAITGDLEVVAKVRATDWTESPWKVEQ